MSRRLGTPDKSLRSDWRAAWILAIFVVVLAVLRIAVAVVRLAGWVAGVTFLVTMLAALTWLFSWARKRTARHAFKARLAPPPGALSAFKVHFGYSQDYALPPATLGAGVLAIYPDQIRLSHNPGERMTPAEVTVPATDILKVEVGTVKQTVSEMAELLAKNYITVRVHAPQGCGMTQALTQLLDTTDAATDEVPPASSVPGMGE